MAAKNTLSTVQALSLYAADGQRLAAMLYRPSAQQAMPKQPHVVLVAGALGVPQRFYAPFCQWLAERGHTAMSFDLRGIGDSLESGQPLRSVKADMLLWARQDFTAAVNGLCEQAGVDQISVIGHSLGAHHAAMGTPEAQQRIAKLVSIAAGAGHWREWAAPTRRLAPVLFYVAMPLLTPLLGYFPGRRLKMIGNLPAGVVWQFRRWCRHPEFAWGAESEKVKPSLDSAKFPIHAIGFSDDETMTTAGIRKLLTVMPHAPHLLESITPEQMGVARIGHTGAFRVAMQHKLWPHIENRLSSVQGA
jgi:predicted alpha/beta hydrolase